MDLVIYLILLFVVVPAAYAAVIGAPTVPSDGKLIKEALKAAEAGPGTGFHELGSGFGGVSKEALKMGAHVTAYELSPFAWLISFMNMAATGKPFRSRLQNFFKADLSEADIIYMFLMPGPIEKLKPKLERELRPGSRVISYAFPVPGWEPQKVIVGEKTAKIYIYKVG